MRSMLRAIGLVVCVGAIGSQSAVAVQGDATAWGARAPGSCPSIAPKAAPSPAQVATMVRCRHESISSGSGELRLMENLNVAVGESMPFVAAYNSYVMPEADTKSRVYPIRGSFTWVVCKSRKDAAIYGNPDKNCYETDVPEAKGVCWKTTFADWRCLLNGPAQGRRDGTSPPKTLAAGQAAQK